MFVQLRAVKFEGIWVGEHMEFKGLEEVLDQIQVGVDEGLLEIFRDGGDDMVRWRNRFVGRFRFGPWSGSQIFREVPYMMVPCYGWEIGKQIGMHAG